MDCDAGYGHLCQGKEPGGSLLGGVSGEGQHAVAPAARACWRGWGGTGREPPVLSSVLLLAPSGIQTGSLSPSKPHLQSTNSTGISRATPKCVSSPAQLGDADHVPSPVWHRMGFPPGWWISSGSPFAAWLAPLALGRLPEALQSNCWLWQTGAKQIDSCSVILRAGGSWTIIVLNCIILEKLFPRLLQRTGQAELGFSCCL